MVELKDRALEVNLDVLGGLSGGRVRAAICGAEHAAGEEGAVGIADLVEGVVVEEEPVEYLVAVLLVDVPALELAVLVVENRQFR